MYAIDAWLESYIDQKGKQPKQNITDDKKEMMQNKIRKRSIDSEFEKVLSCVMM